MLLAQKMDKQLVFCFFNYRYRPLPRKYCAVICAGIPYCGQCWLDAFVGPDPFGEPKMRSRQCHHKLQKVSKYVMTL